MPGGQSGGRDSLLAAHSPQILATEEFQDDGHLALGRPTALAAAAGSGGSPVALRAPSVDPGTGCLFVDMLTLLLSNQCP